MRYLIRVQSNHDLWISDVYGDPGRTTIKKSAIVYLSKRLADDQKEHFEKKYPNRAFSVEKE